jgi:putative ABC transport system permease protein
MTRFFWRRGPDGEDEIDREIDSYVLHEIDDNLARGMTPDQARRAALRKLGNRTRVRESIDEASGRAGLESIVTDLRLGVRQLRRQPGFAVAAIAILALGIATTTAIFSIAYSVLLRSLPYDQPSRLVALSSAGIRSTMGRSVAGAADYFDWRQRQRVFEDLALTRPVANFNLTGAGEPERLQGARATASLFPTLGVEPLLGRTFNEREQLDPKRAGAVAVLSYGLWQRRFGGDSSIVGRTITLNGSAWEVLGVMPADFHYPSRDFELWTPLYLPPAALAARGDYSYLSVARLQPGVTIETARAQMAIVSSEIARELGRSGGTGNDGVFVGPLLAELTGSVRRVLWLLLGSSGLLFVVSVVNLAGLLRARGSYRRAEFALRTSLGATRARLARQLVCETIPLAVAGGIAGIAGAYWLLDVILPTLPASLPRIEEIGLHPPVLTVSALLAVATAFLVSLVPSARATPSVARVAASTAPAADVLIVGQIACTVILLVGAGLLFRSFAHLRGVDPGLRPASVLSLHLAINRSKHGDDPGVAAYLSRVLAQVHRVPGVEAAGVVNRLPMGGQVQGGAVRFEHLDAAINTDWRTASGRYFEALGVPLIAGRTFDERDTPDRPLVGIIDQRLARDVFGDVSPIGKRFRMNADKTPWIEIVGVVGHLRHEGLDVDSRPHVYWPYQQRTQDRMALVVRTSVEPASTTSAVAGAIRSIDADQALYDVRTMTDVIGRTLQGHRLNATLVGAFAVAALALASVGLYGIVSYVSAGRRREFGVRMAVGATTRQVAVLVLREGAVRAAVGLAIGIVAAAVLAQFVGTLLHGVTPWDPVSYVVAPVLMSGVILLASAVPAWRASRIDPVTALRNE